MPKHQGRHQEAGQAAQAGQGGRGAAAAARHLLVLLVAGAVAEAMAKAMAAIALDAWGSSGVTAGQAACRRGVAHNGTVNAGYLSEPGTGPHCSNTPSHTTHMHMRPAKAT